MCYSIATKQSSHVICVVLVKYNLNSSKIVVSGHLSSCHMHLPVHWESSHVACLFFKCRSGSRNVWDTLPELNIDFCISWLTHSLTHWLASSFPNSHCVWNSFIPQICFHLKCIVDFNFKTLKCVTQERPPANLWKKREQSREYRNGNSLRDYQLEGVNWLLFNWYNRSVLNTVYMHTCTRLQPVNPLVWNGRCGLSDLYLQLWSWPGLFCGCDEVEKLWILTTWSHVMPVFWKCNLS